MKMKMKKVLLTSLFIVFAAFGCDKKVEKKVEVENDYACTIILKRTCILSGKTKCFAYATEDLSTCPEGK